MLQDETGDRSNAMLTQKELKKVLHYDQKTGIFIRLIPSGGAIKNSIAGTKHNGRYTRIQIDGNRYLAHRLAWLYTYGYFPENQLDHIDRNKRNNKISNLREVSHQCNNRNCGNPKHNTSSVRGIYWSKSNNKWYTQIKINYKIIYLGYHESFPEAVCHRLAAEQAEDWAGCNSSSPAYQYVKKNIQLA